jgi:hypothetical protein
VWTIGTNGYDQSSTSALTTNVVLWPRTQAIVMSSRRFEALTPTQRRVLLAAGRAALVPETVRLQRLAAPALTTICSDAKSALVTASAADIAALRSAVAPVYRQLERDPETRRLIEAITALGGGGPAPPVAACSGHTAASRTWSPTGLDGTWRWTWTPAELVHVGIAAAAATKLAGTGRVVFRRGRFRSTLGATGSYSVAGDLVTFVFDPPGAPGVTPGVGYTMRWSVYRNLLTFAEAPGSPSITSLLIEPFTRVR